MEKKKRILNGEGQKGIVLVPWVFEGEQFCLVHLQIAEDG